MTTLVLVPGTWGGDPWAEKDTPFRQLLRDNGFAAVRFDGWSEDVDGLPGPLKRGKNSDWIAGGYALSYFLSRMPFEDRNIVCHSHGLQPVLYALARCAAAPADDVPPAVPIRNLISVCSPVRDDMRPVAAAALPFVDRWRHIASTDWDPMQRLGELWDGHFGWVREWTFPRGTPGAEKVVNMRIPHIGHSELLKNPRFLDLWVSAGLFGFLRAADLPEHV